MLSFFLNRLASTRVQLLLAGAFSASALAAALVSQYGFNLHPCELCLYQRYPYAAIVALSLIGVLWVTSARGLRLLLMACIGLLLIDAAIAAYHTGVELDIFQGPDACSSTQSGTQTLEEMRAAIMGAPLVSCKQAMAYFAGLSMATWNMIAASTAALGLLFLFLRNRK